MSTRQSYFVVITLHTDPDGAADQTGLAAEMEKLELGRVLKASEGQPVELPRDTFAGHVNGEDSHSVHQTMHCSLNAVLKKCCLHGRFLITVSEDCDWSCCFY